MVLNGAKAVSDDLEDYRKGMANNTEDVELRVKIKQAQFDLAGRRATHLQVARKSGWTPVELDGVHEGDQIIFENEILSLVQQEVNRQKLELLDRLAAVTKEKWGQGGESWIDGHEILDAIETERKQIKEDK